MTVDVDNLNLAWHVGITGVLVLIVGVLSIIVYKIKQALSNIDDAVNNRHKHRTEGNGLPPKLYDCVLELRAWKKQHVEDWKNLTQRVERHSDQVKDNREKIDTILKKMETQGRDIRSLRLAFARWLKRENNVNKQKGLDQRDHNRTDDSDRVSGCE